MSTSFPKTPSTTSTVDSDAHRMLRWVEQNDRSDRMVMYTEVATEIGLDPEVAYRSLQRLRHAGYVDFKESAVMGPDLEQDIYRPFLTERGLRELAIWPSADAFDLLLERLDQMIADEVDDSERSKLENLRSGAAEVGKGTLSGLLTFALTGGAVG